MLLKLQFTNQFEFLLLFALQLLDVLSELRSLELAAEPLLDLQHFLGNAAEGLRYLMDQLLVVIKVILGSCPQVGLVSSG